MATLIYLMQSKYFLSAVMKNNNRAVNYYLNFKYFGSTMVLENYRLGLRYIILKLIMNNVVYLKC